LQNLPPIPPGAEHLWLWFNDLDAKRQAGFSINALSWGDIAAYFTLHGIKPMRWEIDAIARLDNAFLVSRLDSKSGQAKGAGALKRSMTGKAAK